MCGSLVTFDPYARKGSSQIAMVSSCKLSTIFVDIHEYSITAVSFLHWRLRVVSSVALRACTYLNSSA